MLQFPLCSCALSPQHVGIQSRAFSKKRKNKNKNKKSGGDDHGDGDDDDDAEDAAFDWDPDIVRMEMEDAMERLEAQLARIRSGRNHVESFNAVCNTKERTPGASFLWWIVCQ